MRLYKEPTHSIYKMSSHIHTYVQHIPLTVFQIYYLSRVRNETIININTASAIEKIRRTLIQNALYLI